MNERHLRSNTHCLLELIQARPHIARRIELGSSTFDPSAGLPSLVYLVLWHPHLPVADVDTSAESRIGPSKLEYFRNVPPKM